MHKNYDWLWYYLWTFPVCEITCIQAYNNIHCLKLIIPKLKRHIFYHCCLQWLVMSSDRYCRIKLNTRSVLCHLSAPHRPTINMLVLNQKSISSNSKYNPLKLNRKKILFVESTPQTHILQPSKRALFFDKASLDWYCPSSSNQLPNALLLQAMKMWPLKSLT